MRPNSKIILQCSIALMLAGCQTNAERSGRTACESRLATAQIDNARLIREMTEAKAAVVKQSKAAKPSKATKAAEPEPWPEPDYPEDTQISSKIRCLPDYCPCDETGPVDKMLCRNMKAGLDVDNAMLASGAAARDLRVHMDKWNRDNPDNQVPQ